MWSILVGWQPVVPCHRDLVLKSNKSNTRNKLLYKNHWQTYGLSENEYPIAKVNNYCFSTRKWNLKMFSIRVFIKRKQCLIFNMQLKTIFFLLQLNIVSTNHNSWRPQILFLLIQKRRNCLPPPFGWFLLITHKWKTTVGRLFFIDSINEKRTIKKILDIQLWNKSFQRLQETAFTLRNLGDRIATRSQRFLSS